MESWWLTQKLGHSGCLEQGQAGGMWGLGGALPGLGPGAPHRPRAGTPWSGGVPATWELLVWPSAGSGLGSPDAAQVAFSFPPSSLGSSFRFSATSFICCRENRGH